jgi:hypothetical protein
VTDLAWDAARGAVEAQSTASKSVVFQRSIAKDAKALDTQHLQAQLVEVGAVQLGKLEGRQLRRPGARVQVERHARLAPPRTPPPLLLACR